jgi:uncharacterized membrane protein YfcA
MYWQLIIAGLTVGALVGLTGMGGGSLMTPLLVLVFGFNPTVAVGTDLLHGAVFKSVGAVRHRRLGTVQARLSGWMFVGSAPMSLVGVAVATWLKHSYSDAVSVQSSILGVALVLGGLGTLAKALIRYRERPDVPFVLTNRDRVVAVAIGLGGGFIVGLTSVGSGVFFGLTLLLVFPLRSAKVVGTDIFHAAALLWVAGFGHLIAGNVDIAAVAWLLVGSVPGVLIGSSFVLRVPDRALRLVLGAVLVLAGVKLADVPGANWVAGGGLVVVTLAVAVVATRAVVLFRYPRRAEPSAVDPL